MKTTLILLLLMIVWWVGCQRDDSIRAPTQTSVAPQQITRTNQMRITWQTNDPPLASQLQYLAQTWAPLELTVKEFALLLDLWCKDQAIIKEYSTNLNGDWLAKASEPVDVSIKTLLGQERYRIYKLTEITGYAELYAIVKRHKLPMEIMEKFVALREKTAQELSNLKGIDRINGTSPIFSKMRRALKKMLGQAAWDEFKVVLPMAFYRWDGRYDD